MPRHIPLPRDLLEHPFSVAEGEARGIGRGRLRGQDLARPFHGVRLADLALPPDPPAALLTLCAAYQRRCPAGHFFSHVTAAALWGAPLPPAMAHRPLDVSVLKPHALPRANGVIGHRLADERVRVVERTGVRVADPASTWCQLGPLLAFDDLVAAGDHLVLKPIVSARGDPRPHISLPQLLERASAARAPGAARLRTAAALVRVGAESRPETVLRLALMRAGLPEPLLNAPIHDARGRLLGYGDLVYPAHRVIVEYNGGQHRTDEAQFEKDVTRVEDFRADGWTVVEVRKGGLFRQRAGTVERVRWALGA
ncbi:hypothetical protein [Herbiconiux daphne]|uniref:DUF559 domain-containing protein n=1 Tax=Herbiconiux daphne TaxID=2970914 RepID=A0ABT2GYL5_9MICO|nr:hypothetical protein [Herbiconiux daphne]MCS5733053.1 hypothetical protein [Herbiconiux daphne]